MLPVRMHVGAPGTGGAKMAVGEAAASSELKAAFAGSLIPPAVVDLKFPMAGTDS